MKIDWVRKLTSRKLWFSVAAFVSMLYVAFGGSAEQSERITALIIAGAEVIAYVIGEGLADSARVEVVTVEDASGSMDKTNN